MIYRAASSPTQKLKFERSLVLRQLLTLGFAVVDVARSPHNQPHFRTRRLVHYPKIETGQGTSLIFLKPKIDADSRSMQIFHPVSSRE